MSSDQSSNNDTTTISDIEENKMEANAENHEKLNGNKKQSSNKVNNNSNKNIAQFTPEDEKGEDEFDFSDSDFEMSDTEAADAPSRPDQVNNHSPTENLSKTNTNVSPDAQADANAMGHNNSPGPMSDQTNESLMDAGNNMDDSPVMAANFNSNDSINNADDDTNNEPLSDLSSFSIPIDTNNGCEDQSVAYIEHNNNVDDDVVAQSSDNVDCCGPLKPSHLNLDSLTENQCDDDHLINFNSNADCLASPPPFSGKTSASSSVSSGNLNSGENGNSTRSTSNGSSGESSVDPKLMEPFCPIPTTPRKFVDSIDNDDDDDGSDGNKRKFFPQKSLSSGKLRVPDANPVPNGGGGDSKTNGRSSRNKSTVEGDGGGGGSHNGDDEVFYSGEDNDNDDNYDDDDYDDEDYDEDKIIVDFLGQSNSFAEARLAARRQARAEAREIRMRELERQQKEMDQNADRAYDMQATTGIDPIARSRLTAVGNHIGNNISHLRAPTNGGSMSSRRSSEDSLEEEGRSIRDIRHELKDLEERFRKAMIANAQLDNERTSHTYQIELLKDQLEEKGEKFAQLQREYKEKSRESNALKRNVDKLEEELRLVKGQLDERDRLISEQGLVIVLIENEDGTDAKRALVSVENAQVLDSVQGSLDVRLKKFTEEKKQLQKEVNTLQQQVDELKSQGRGRSSMNGPLGADEEYEAQREANKLIAELKYKIQKAEQEIASLQASLARSETQVIRYKSTAEAAEKAEAELKIERRKLQRENREAMERLEELETSNNHLLKRLDKLKTAKSTLLKEL